jgi:hypothetical protein
MRNLRSKTFRTSEKSKAKVCPGGCLQPDILGVSAQGVGPGERVEPATGLIANPGPSTGGTAGFFITSKRDFS